MHTCKHTDQAKERQRKQKRCRAVIKMNAHGKVLDVYYSVSEAARVSGITRTGITNALRSEYGYHLSGGYLWKYLDSFTQAQIDKLLRESILGKH